MRALTQVVAEQAGDQVRQVLGLQRTMHEWASRQGWGGRPVDHKEAKGILVAALGVLEAACR